MNDTHVSYINQIITRNEDNQPPAQLMAPIIREYVIPWHCIYPLEYVVDLETTGEDGDTGYYIPEISPVEYITIQSPLLQKENTYPVFMQLFETENYRKPFTEAPILENTDKLYVEVKMVGPSDASIQLVNCWATPFGGVSQEEIDDYRFDLIEDYCVTEEASDSVAAQIIKNGQSHSSQYEANVFKYSQEVDTDKVYLHCNVRVCFEENGRCDVTTGFCDGIGNSRKRRSANPGLTGNHKLDSAELALDPSITTVHAGPFTLKSNDAYLVESIKQLERSLEMATIDIIERQEAENNNELFGLPVMFIYCFIAIIVIIISLIFGIIFLVLRRKQSNKKQQKVITENTLKVIEEANNQAKATTYVVTQNSATGGLNTSKVAVPQVIHTNIPVTIPGALPVASGVNGRQHREHRREQRQPRHANHQDDRHSDTDSDRFSRSTHQTNLPHSTIANSYTTSSDQSERAAYAESQHTDVSSVPGTSRSSSHKSVNSESRPAIVAKVRQDSYQRIQGHNNNLTNAYNQQRKSKSQGER